MVTIYPAQRWNAQCRVASDLSRVWRKMIGHAKLQRAGEHLLWPAHHGHVGQTCRVADEDATCVVRKGGADVVDHCTPATGCQAGYVNPHVGAGADGWSFLPRSVGDELACHLVHAEYLMDSGLARGNGGPLAVGHRQVILRFAVQASFLDLNARIMLCSDASHRVGAGTRQRKQVLLIAEFAQRLLGPLRLLQAGRVQGLAHGRVLTLSDSEGQIHQIQCVEVAFATGNPAPDLAQHAAYLHKPARDGARLRQAIRAHPHLQRNLHGIGEQLLRG